MGLLSGQHVLVHRDKTFVTAHINKQGGTRCIPILSPPKQCNIAVPTVLARKDIQYYLSLKAPNMAPKHQNWGS